MKTYMCNTTCTWNGRYWREGDITSPLPNTIIPPAHFTEETKEDSEIVEVEEIVELKEEVINQPTYTRENLRGKKYTALVKIAKDNGVYKESLRSVEMLIKAILAGVA